MLDGFEVLFKNYLHCFILFFPGRRNSNPLCCRNHQKSSPQWFWRHRSSQTNSRIYGRSLTNDKTGAFICLLILSMRNWPPKAYFLSFQKVCLVANFCNLCSLLFKILISAIKRWIQVKALIILLARLMIVSTLLFVVWLLWLDSNSYFFVSFRISFFDKIR